MANHSDGPDEGDWSTVSLKYWWRRGEFTPHRRRPASNVHHLPMAKRMQGMCLRCLGKGHSAASCTEPMRCINCGCIGHKAHVCKSATPRRPQHYHPLLPNSRPPKLSPTPPPNAKRPHQAMAQLGDLEYRP